MQFPIELILNVTDAFHKHVFLIIATSGSCDIFVLTKRTTHKQTLTFLTNRWLDESFLRVSVTNTLSVLGCRSRITGEKTHEKSRLPHGVTSHVLLNVQKIRVTNHMWNAASSWCMKNWSKSAYTQFSMIIQRICWTETIVSFSRFHFKTVDLLNVFNYEFLTISYQ